MSSDEIEPQVEPHVGAVARVLRPDAVGAVGVVEVVVAPVIRRLTDTPATVIERLFKPTVMWSKRIVIA